MNINEEERRRCINRTKIEILKMEKELDDYDRNEARRLKIKHIGTLDVVNYGGEKLQVDEKELIALFRNVERLLRKEFPYHYNGDYQNNKKLNK